MTFRLLGIPDELRLEIEEASGGTITTEAARLIMEKSVQEAEALINKTLDNITKEVQGIVGPHGTISRLQAGGIQISRGSGIAVYEDGVLKTTIAPNGTLIVGSDITNPATTTEYFFVTDDIYNGEQFGAGDFLIGDNSTGQSNLKWDASEGQLQFRYGQTTQAYMDTDGSIKAGGGAVIMDSSALKIVNLTDGADPFIIFYNSTLTTLGQIFTNSSGNLELDAYGVSGGERKLVLRSQTGVGPAGISTIELIANSGGTGIDWITLNAEKVYLNGTTDVETNGTVIINVSQEDKDFRVHGDTVTDVLKVDAGNERVEFGADHFIPTRSSPNPRVYFNEANQDMDFSIETVDDAAAFYMDAALNKSTSFAWDGWAAGIGTWSYSSADDPTFVISINKDVTGLIGVGDRIRLTQTTVKYFIVTAVGSFSGGATLVTVFGGTDYDLANASITSPYYSHAKAPLGFPLDPSKWTVELSDTSERDQASPSQNTWYNIGSLSISIPIGVWRVEYFVNMYGVDTQGPNCFGTLSTANNSESDVDFTSFVSCYFPSLVSTNTAYAPSTKAKFLTLAAKTTYYLNIKTSNSGQSNIGLNGSIAKTFVRAICAYL